MSDNKYITDKPNDIPNQQVIKIEYEWNRKSGRWEPGIFIQYIWPVMISKPK
jgi:hypothetical protein